MPYAQNLQVNFQDTTTRRRRSTWRWPMATASSSWTVWRNYVVRAPADTFHNWDMIRRARADRRRGAARHVRIAPSRTHMRFGMPAYGVTWIDTDIDPPLTWSQGVIS